MGTPGKTGMGINWNNRKMGITGIPEKMGWGSWKHRDWNHGNSQEKMGWELPETPAWGFTGIPGEKGIGSRNSQENRVDIRNSWEKWDWLQQFPGKVGWGFPGNWDGRWEFPGKQNSFPKKKKIRLGLHRESGVRDWGGNQGLDPVGIWDLGIGSHSQRQSQGIPGTFLMAYVGSPGRIRTILPSQNSATTRSFFQPCQEFPKKPFRTVDPGIWDWGILESQDWRILRLGDPRILRLGDPRIGGSWNSRTGGF